MGVHLSVNLGKKVFYSCWRPFSFFLVFTWIWEIKCFIFDEDLFFFWSSPKFGDKSVPFAFFLWSSLNFHIWTKSWSRFIPSMLKIGQNWGKIANYPPQCSTKIGTTGFKSFSKISSEVERCCEKLRSKTIFYSSSDLGKNFRSAKRWSSLVRWSLIL